MTAPNQPQDLAKVLKNDDTLKAAKCLGQRMQDETHEDPEQVVAMISLCIIWLAEAGYRITSERLP